MYGQDILCGIFLWNSTQNILPLHGKIYILLFYSQLKISELLDLRAYKLFVKQSLGDTNICVSELNRCCLGTGLYPGQCLASHNLNQHCLVVNEQTSI